MQKFSLLAVSSENPSTYQIIDAYRVDFGPRWWNAFVILGTHMLAKRKNTFGHPMSHVILKSVISCLYVETKKSVVSIAPMAEV